MSNPAQHIEQLRQEWSCYIFGARPMQPARVAALDAGIAALEREGQMESQLSPDLEPVRRMIEQVKCNFTYEAGVLVQKALPALKALLAEVERLREENTRAVLAERGACAEIALGHQISETSLSAEWGRQCAAAIRRRSKL